MARPEVSVNIRYDFRNPEFARVSMADRYAAALEQIQWADRLGFESVSLSEHHGADDGYLPSMFAFAGAIAARTTHVTIRLTAVIAPFHDPLRVAEDLAVLDNLSRGRMEVVFGGGYVPSEFVMFGRDPKERPRAITEAVATMRAAWSGEPFKFRGRAARITPTPVRPGGPPILLGASSEAGARRAARIADGFSPTTPDLWVYYRDELTKLGKPDPGEIPTSSGMYLHVSNDPESTWGVVGPYALYEMNAYGKWAAESGAATETTSATGYLPMEDVAMLRSFGMHNILTPDELVEKASSGAMQTLMFHPMMGGLTPEISWANLRLFETAVLPRLR